MSGFEIKASSNADEFIQYLNKVEHGFIEMIETMRNVAKVVQENTLPLTPFEHGKLGRSFKTYVLADNSRMKIIQVRMSALNERTGYDYAWIQHENTSYHHPSLESEKKHPAFGDIMRMNILSHIGGTNNPTDHYLFEGIRQSKDGAFQLIEEDYLSLFSGGHIY